MEFSLFKDINISKVGFGCASLSSDGGGYGFGRLSDSERDYLVHGAIDRGVNLFDNAPIYGFGKAEENLGIALKHKRQDCVIISKCGVNWHDSGRVNMTNDPALCLAQLESSLKRLQTDYIDIYMVHWPDARVDINLTLEPLIKAQNQGKIKYLGLSNTNSQDLLKARSVAQIDFLQAESNLFNDTFVSGSEDFFKTAWGTFDKGILSGSVKSDSQFDKFDCRSWAPWWKKSNWKNKVAKFEKISTILKKENIDPAQFMIKYNIEYKNIDSTLCGINKPHHLDTLTSLDNLKIENSLFEEIEKLINE